MFTVLCTCQYFQIKKDIKKIIIIEIIYCSKQLIVSDSLAALLFNVSSSKFRLVQTVGAGAAIFRNLAARALAAASRPTPLLGRSFLSGLLPRLPWL